MAPAPVHRALSPETNGNAADVSGRQMERSPSKALTDAYAKPSKIPKFNQAGTSTGSLHRQASRGIQCCSSQPKLDIRCTPAYACMTHFPCHQCHHKCYMTFLCTARHKTCTHDLFCGTACNQLSTIFCRLTSNTILHLKMLRPLTAYIL